MLAQPAAEQFVTGSVGEHVFALPIAHVRDVFVPERITPVPGAPSAVSGLMNLRGRVLTAVDLRTRLGIVGTSAGPTMAIGVEYGNEAYGLLVDAVDDVIAIGAEERESAPANLDPLILRFAASVHERDRRLLILLDVERLLETETAEN